MGVKARRYDARVVQNQQVAGVEQRRKLGEARVAQCACCAIHRQHAALAALGWRLLRDQLGGEIEVKIGDAQAGHARDFLKWSRALMRARSIAAFNCSRIGSNCSLGRSAGT